MIRCVQLALITLTAALQLLSLRADWTIRYCALIGHLDTHVDWTVRYKVKVNVCCVDLLTSLPEYAAIYGLQYCFVR